ncbi:ankyrin repeat domain-containing protein [Flavobacterium algicola]|uniref:ankyrin repeat domain-containing protein n=1 Tax=Flavobacterium algicola TaxID=556529 RepID=UPI001EFEAF9C|nr:ankyrin repeat domain-containing protein [Flavobacterium algicola]MCG9791871.1 ankyrin repeat domain-containing protein [Flavobacterium algicola]
MKKLYITTLFTLIIIGFVSCVEKVKENQKLEQVLMDDAPFTGNQTSEVENSEPTWQVVDEFYDAIFENDSDKVKMMVKTKFPPNFQPKNKISPLEAIIWAADNIDLFKFMVDQGTTMNKKEENFVLIAAEYKRLKIMKFLVENGIDYKDNGSFNKAGFYQFYEGAKYLLLNGARQDSGDVRGKLWVFYEAVRKSDYEVLDALKLTKDEISSNECDGESALIIAIKENNLNMVKYLVKKGADKDKPETFDCGDDIAYGKLPVEIAKANKFYDIVAFLQ